MDPNTFPTKGNLILAKNSLALSLQGFDLMDKKRNILIREMMNLIDEAKGIQSQIDVTFREAYGALQRANMEIGINTVQTISYTVPIEDSIRIKTRSIMGTEIPLVESESSGDAPTYEEIDGAWLSDRPYATIHRVASDGTHRGVFAEVMAFAMAMQPHLRIDTHAQNLPMQRQIERFGFRYCGVIQCRNGARMAFERVPEKK